MRRPQRTPRRLAVGLDLDGCFFWFHRAYINGCHRVGIPMTDPAGLDEAMLEWDFYLELGHSLRMFLDNCAMLADLGLLWDGPPIPGSRSTWMGLVVAGHEIHVKTDRSFGSHPAVSEAATRIWLRHQELPYDTITFGPDKTAGPVCDIMLEDKLSNYDALAATSCTPVLINRPWNQDPGDDRVRVDTHDEFFKLVGTAEVAHRANQGAPVLV